MINILALHRVWRVLMIFLFVAGFQPILIGQDCSIISKANDITPDRLCSPVTVDWEVSFRGVNSAGTSVQIRYEWDDGSVDTYNAVNVNPDPAVREWAFTASHTYTSDDDQCNYRPVATLIVNGQVCSSSSQQQIVTVWDNDNSNGGRLLIDPPVFPICFGSAANARFQDNTQFNCVPPQENDVPNTATRWIQWIYGTDITMTGTPVTINGANQAFPYSGNIITLPGPVTGSGVFSEVMNVASDKFVGQYFEVSLRYWNYCNPYDDPLIPGPPADPVNGDNDPMTTTAIILIVPLPDPEITPLPPVCDGDDPFHLSAADVGGSWSGDGISNTSTGQFNPSDAGNGSHIIRYDITDGNNCSSWDTVVISVLPGPDATIQAVDPQCIDNSAISLVSAAATGTWSGTGITNTSLGIFNPSTAGSGIHTIRFVSDPDANGCMGKDEEDIRVLGTLSAGFLTEDSAWCERGPTDNKALIELKGDSYTDFDLIWQVNGQPDTIYGVMPGILEVRLPVLPGTNTYRLRNVTGHFGNVTCESSLNDPLQLKIYPKPQMSIGIDTEGECSPVLAKIAGSKGSNFIYSWDFGDGTVMSGDTSVVFHSFYNATARDTTYSVKLMIETQHGCVDSIREGVKVYPNPIADFFVSPVIQDYPSTIVNLINYTSEGSWQYEWAFGDGTTDVDRDPQQHDYGTYGEFYIWLKSFSEYCADSIVKKVRIIPPPPVAAFSPDAEGCGPLTVAFKNESEYADSYLWDFDDGNFSTEKDPVHTFIKGNRYRVMLTAMGQRGLSESFRYITVHPDPDVSFRSFPESATRINQVFRFVNNTDGAVRYWWDFGDGNSSQDPDPSHVYGKEGVFDVSLYAWSEFDCPDTLTLEKYIKVVQSEGALKYPNAFRWNKSGPTGGYWKDGEIDNSVFHPHFENVAEYRLVIYSRWGEMLYESDDLHKGWDGYFGNNELAPQGVYVYKAWVKYMDGSSEVKLGDVTFLH